MIRNLSSSLKSFKELHFHSGLNILLAQKEPAAGEKQTRNRAGKTSMIELIHFLLAAEVKKGDLAGHKALENITFSLVCDVEGKPIQVSRNTAQRDHIQLTNPKTGVGEHLKNKQWGARLGNAFFNLDQVDEYYGKKPSFRSLFSYFARRRNHGGLLEAQTVHKKQSLVDTQIPVMYLLGLEWDLAVERQNIRDRAKHLEQLQKAQKAGTLGPLLATVAKLRTEIAIKEERLAKSEEDLAAFKVLPGYRDLEKEANDITARLTALTNEDFLDKTNMEEIRKSLEVESPPQLSRLEAVYREAGAVLPGLVKKRYEEVRAFHQSVVDNRRYYLLEELRSLEAAIQEREKQQEALEKRRSELLKVLQSHGALDQWSALQAQNAALKSEWVELKKKLETAREIEQLKTHQKLEIANLKLRLENHLNEMESALNQAVLTFENVSRRLYESAGSIIFKAEEKGFGLEFPIQGKGSAGIDNMQIFCFDMMLMRLCRERGYGIDVLIHDSHLFDGVDGRQVISALKVGAELAEQFGFQYIVTMNEDDAYKETIAGFDIDDYVLPVRLMDATEDGGLFGFRF